MTAPFRIGGIYKQRNGEIVRLDPPQWGWDARHDACAVVLRGMFLGHAGARRLSDGAAAPYVATTCPYSLIPGECDEHGNPLEDKKEPETLGSILRKALEREPVVTVKRVARPSHSEPKRAPLPYFTERTPFDPFADYAVKSSVILGAGPNEFTGSGPLQRSPDLQDESLSRHQLATVKG